MKSFKPFWLSLFERFAACVLIVTLLPMLLVVILLILGTAGSPIIVTDELPTIDGAVANLYRFRTTGRGTSSFFPAIGRFLRAYSFDELPGLGSVARGDMKLRDFLRSR